MPAEYDSIKNNASNVRPFFIMSYYRALLVDKKIASQRAKGQSD